VGGGVIGPVLVRAVGVVPAEDITVCIEGGGGDQRVGDGV